MYMNVFTVFFCLTSLYDMNSFFLGNVYRKRSEYQKFFTREADVKNRFSIKPNNLVIDDKILQNDEDENNNNNKTKASNGPNNYLNPRSKYAQFIQRKYHKKRLDGCDHRWKINEPEYFKYGDEIENHAKNQKKLSILRTLENTHVYKITKLQLIQNWPVFFTSNKKALYRGFEEFEPNLNTEPSLYKRNDTELFDENRR